MDYLSTSYFLISLILCSENKNKRSSLEQEHEPRDMSLIIFNNDLLILPPSKDPSLFVFFFLFSLSQNSHFQSNFLIEDEKSKKEKRIFM
ncbi:hypothetical protein EUTSA_v10000398mg [Eutrema salsugineum]|uniref:Uncharacterized protein n=1 Tax=Eutrema salsugineum TaxID=72664 RepID=V4L719_EUTSA|nr:hypothetical protein EUTSA_v10000398mg [Eutrema salsugineum]